MTINITEEKSFDIVISKVIEEFSFSTSKFSEVCSFSDSIINSFKEEFRKILLPVLVQEINLFRIGKGTNSKYSEYNEFCKNILNNGLYFLDKYPVLKRRLNLLKENYEISIECFLKNLTKNYNEIIENFDLRQENISVKILSMVGDNHGSNRNISFQLQNKSFFYKTSGYTLYPILNELNCRVFDSKYFKFPDTFIGSNFMIQEKIDNLSCHDKSQIHSFYRNMGVLLAFTYVLNGNDMHNENIIACKEHPYVIDFETLINPVSQIEGRISQSIFSTGLLPMKYRRNFDGIFDCSSIGQVNIVVKKVFEEINPFSSELRLELTEHQFNDIKEFLPLLHESHISANKFLGDIESGFIFGYSRLRSCYKIIKTVVLRYKNALLCRLVLRNTSVYSALIDRITVPDLLMDELKTRNVLTSFLKEIPVISSHEKKYIMLEVEQLVNGEVPLFTFGNFGNVSRNDTKYLMSLYDSVNFKLNCMSDEDLQYQLNLLRVCLNIDNYNFSKLRNNHLELDVKKLVRESIFNVTRPYALTLQKDSSGNYIYGESNLGLYEGKLGLLLSYDELEEIFDLKVIEQEIINSKDIGLINGYASLLLYKNLNNSLNKDDYLLHDIDFTEFDIIDGLGGLILQSYLIFLKKPELVDVVELKKLGEIFLELTKNQEQFKVGFAHGFTGIKVIYKICSLILPDNSEFMNRFEYFESQDNVLLYPSSGWCNGLTGYLVSEYILYKISNDSRYLDKVLSNIDYLMNKLCETEEYCLCHGFLGGLDFLQVLNQDNLLSNEHKKRLEILEKTLIFKSNHNNILKKDISLFTGISGFLYYLKRKKTLRGSVITLGF
ncbi:type 2 lantipeptide synthetase LanM family protein [Streptococcus suis]|uniref:type 2 lanthipeptide synthetase LanM family protein n=1 Tax=Streptococcus suis TaxID=1307 RepID=UPI0019605F22|nr:type 2 lanthipeptide synthetase LanM family protein [Streptococcus suis]MBM7180780.1 type 2 lantipeptide synthetase LanM family protein [Streptococcus suis]